MKKTGAVKMCAIVLFLLLAMSIAFSFAGNAAEGLTFSPDRITAETRENIKGSLAFHVFDIDVVRLDQGFKPALDTETTLANLQKIYQNVTGVVILGNLTYPQTPVVGANALNIENISVYISYVDEEGYDDNCEISGFSGYATAYLSGGSGETEPEDTTDTSEPPETQITDVNVKVSEKTVVYGDPLVFDYEVEALPAGLTVDGEPTYSVTGTPDVGEYEVTLSGLNLSGEGSENYRINYVPGSLTVKPRPISISVKDDTAVYGEAAPDFEITLFEGTLVGGDKLENIIKNIEFICPYEIGSPVLDEGYPVNVSENYTVDKNYEVKNVKSGTLTVDKRIIYILPHAAEKYESTDDPELSYSYSGNFYVDVPAFSGKLSRESGESVGSYAFTLGTLTLIDEAAFCADNYILKLDPHAPKFEIKREPFDLKISAVSLTLRDRVHITYRLEIGELLNGAKILSFGVLEWSGDEYASLVSHAYKDNTDFAFEGESLQKAIEGKGILPTEYMQSFFCIAYVKTDEGYIYSEAVEYSVADYAEYIFRNHEDYENVLPILVSVLDYGTEAMRYCGVEVNTYPSDLVPDALRDGGAFDEELCLNARSDAENAKSAEIVINDKVTSRLGVQSVSADLHECISLRLAVLLDPLSEKRTVTLYYWKVKDAEDKNGKTVLDISAAHTVEATENANKYTATIEGISPAEAGELYYVAFAVRTGETTSFSTVKVCGADLYAAELTEYYPDGVTNALAQALLTYTNEARKYVASETDQ